MAKLYAVVRAKNGTQSSPIIGTVEELTQYFSYTLEKGRCYEHERGNKKINMNPKGGKSLVNNVNNALNNAAANGYANQYYVLIDTYSQKELKEMKETN